MTRRLDYDPGKSVLTPCVSARQDSLACRAERWEGRGKLTIKMTSSLRPMKRVECYRLEENTTSWLLVLGGI